MSIITLCSLENTAGTVNSADFGCFRKKSSKAKRIIATSPGKKDRLKGRASADVRGKRWPRIMPWISLAGVAIGALNASSEMIIRRFFAASGEGAVSGLDVLGLVSTESLLRMRQLSDVGWVLLVVSVAAIGSSTWKARTGACLWVFAVAALIRVALIRYLTHWPSSAADLDIVWSIPGPLVLPVGVITGMAVAGLVLAAVLLRWNDGEAGK